MSRIALVSVPTMSESYHSLQGFIAILFPVSLLTIASVLEKDGNEVLLYDAEARRSSFRQTLEDVLAFRPDVVGVTAMTPTVVQAGAFCRAIKERAPGIRTVIGGVHATALPERTLEEFDAIDAVVKGEGEQTFPSLIRAWASGSSPDGIPGVAWRQDDRITGTQQPAPIRYLDGLPLPAYHLIDGSQYRSYGWNRWNAGVRSPMASMFTSRGCYHSCTFCASQVTLGRGIRYFGVERVLEEIDLLVRLFGIRILYINDDTFAASPKRTAAICEGLIRRNYDLNIMISARCDEADPDLFRIMRKAGVDWCFFGIESGNQDILDSMKKGTTLDQIERSLRIARQVGMHVGGNFVIGMPDDTDETIRQTIDLALRNRMEYASFAICIPFPGTELFDTLKTTSCLPKWTDFRLTNSNPIPLGSLSPAELQAWRFKATLSFFARPEYVLRLMKRFSPGVILEDFTRMGLDILWERWHKRF